MIRIILLFTLLLPGYCFSQNQPHSSQEQAIRIADSVIMAMGGKENWDKVHYLKWNFFGRRTLLWDKWTGNVRIEIPSKQLLIVTNINTRQGHVFRNGKELVQPDSITYFMDRGYKIWANDSYWLIMPFKLKDPGVNLSYLGSSRDSLGNPCSILELTFNNVGVTPQNKYHVYVDAKSYLITQWDYFENYNDAKPEVSNPWLNYQSFGKILLSDDRGSEEGKITDIAVMNDVPQRLFEKP